MKNVSCATFIATLLAFNFSSAWAKDKQFEFACDKAKFSLTAIPDDNNDEGSLGITKLVISARLNKEYTRLIFDNRLRTYDGEYFHVGCLTNKNRSYFIFQNFCGGSGCTEGRYGIIDTKSLEILLTPSTPNFEQAKYLLNADIPELRLIDAIR
jgi:hypothetical protein